ncbi:MAG: hypothetical protein V7L22_34415 [Nostoc sp.]
MAYFAQVVGVWYSGSLHYALHNVFDDSTTWNFTTASSTAFGNVKDERVTP